ncbi:hypothetical protein SAMN05444722_3366 [Rhodovulum sp. ES.010]|uniref:hypothetical protein n=1 Tax=Rhodovulum sp. ES.010 TaxID=1882821 RepID=UPI000928EF8E|nr:hypothetical protein [Rhodovulum sp. ES.010]SIO54461.1 hypothetical protein SAMN05444722_3366 [Rhodovulum sp. ES.010]
MSRPSPFLAAPASLAALLLLVATDGPARAQGEIPDPMATPNPMMPNPGQPMSPLSVAPMQPLGGLGAQPETGVARAPELGNLPIGPGLEDTYYTCTACHSAQTFAQQRLTDERWSYLWGWMIREQGMPDYGEELKASILDYLTTHFSSER